MEAMAIPIETPLLSINDIIEDSQEKYLQEKIFRARWKSIRASGIDDVCNRRLFCYMTCGELADGMSTDLVSIFEEGKDQEPGVRRFLSELGFEIKKAGVNEEWKQYNISGSVDGVIEFGGERLLVEIKTVSEFAWESIQSSEDLKDGYYRKWFGQMQVYLLLFNLEKGIFVLKRKQAKQIRIIEVNLDYEYAEKLIKKAEIVNQAVKDNIPPEFLKDNPVECKKCPFFAKVCNLPLNFGDGIQDIEDAELATKLARREELLPVRSEYEKLDKEIKERVKDIPDAICGDWHITGKIMTRNMSAQEAREISFWQSKFERINGTKEVAG